MPGAGRVTQPRSGGDRGSSPAVPHGHNKNRQQARCYSQDFTAIISFSPRKYLKEGSLLLHKQPRKESEVQAFI